MAHVNPKTLERLNSLARRRIILDASLDKLKERNKRRRETIKTIFDRMIGRIEAQITKVDGMLWRAIDTQRDELTPTGERSFTTRWVKFQFRNVPAATKVKNATGALAVAKRRGILKKVAGQTWVLNEEKLLAYLNENPDERQHYRACLEEVPGHETLSIKLNEGHDVTFDNKKLSPKAVPINRS